MVHEIRFADDLPLARSQAGDGGVGLLSQQRIVDTPLADDIHFVFLADHPLAANLDGPKPSEERILPDSKALAAALIDG